MQLGMFEDIKEKSTDWKWSFKDYPQKNGLKVFSCFACGGGSTMGYKLAGCDVIGDLEIDPRMNKVYVENHHPKYNYLMDIRDFNKIGEPQIQEYIEHKDEDGYVYYKEPIPMKELPKDLPAELYDLDVLDGSPPCSTFSMAGSREDAWGKEKKFREGQKMQTLDDLLFVFIDTVAKLQPKVAIMENVEGLTLGNAWKYVQQIYKRFEQIGYKVKHWLLKGEEMGVPQTRHRVFFIATRLDFNLDKINMYFNYEPITYGEIKEGHNEPNKDALWYELLNHAVPQDKSLQDIRIRMGMSPAQFNCQICWEKDILPTIPAKLELYDPIEKTKLSAESLRNAQTFPQDYDFGSDLAGNVCYLCGMSVPPVMIKRIMNRLIESGLFNYKLGR